MTDNTRNEFARHSLEILKLVVLDVLYQQPLDSTGKRMSTVRGAKICEQLNMPKVSNRLMRGLLDILEDNEYAEKVGIGAWQITNKGISVIEKENLL